MLKQHFKVVQLVPTAGSAGALVSFQSDVTGAGDDSSDEINTGNNGGIHAAENEPDPALTLPEVTRKVNAG
ncbi:hypothetical protein G7Y89_g7439 [Cudoniella acicularis]|uniref:Uncharacterized protein n=1 Tax=Cudoniella acicularis TaxID=354080 RepID=A0A8H4W4K0_9HELO|nr:hypothetical protein G7Y89_g7439 [Cudoniella acicularis]